MVHSTLTNMTVIKLWCCLKCYFGTLITWMFLVHCLVRLIYTAKECKQNKKSLNVDCCRTSPNIPCKLGHHQLNTTIIYMYSKLSWTSWGVNKSLVTQNLEFHAAWPSLMKGHIKLTPHHFLRRYSSCLRFQYYQHLGESPFRPLQ